MSKFLKRMIFPAWMGSVVALALLSGCTAQGTRSGGSAVTSTSNSGLVAHASPATSFLKLNSIAILPVTLDRSVREVVNNDLTSLLEDSASRGGEFDLIPQKKIGATLNGGKVSAGETVAERAKRVGRATQADGVLVTNLMRYVERSGSKVGSTSPARVYFTMSLIRPSDGQTLWEGSYHYDDQALSENLFRLGEKNGAGKSGWRTARELLKEGFQSAFSDIAERRRSAFVGH